ncbi:putative mitochondrial protein [Cucumis melo var. makuwa]|uniref:Mitochondrial protein n=1 Tax=Cucumis melo var. makuwa TaxID=1194695 RepID=A0A5A7T6N7_CUCMM|nr:putative mitochondrial protein [Cucumis melo var. makuwa]TYK07523.1 putative mitochondrial protein [Cucumis melo var. makuwa]
MTPSGFLGFVHDRQCNSIMMPFSVHFYFYISFVPRPRYQHTNLLLMILFCITMVYFTERLLSGVRHLVVSSDRNQSIEDELNFLVEKPWAGSFADRWPPSDNNLILPRLFVEIPLFVGKTAWVLQSCIHNEAPNSDRALTLEQHLIEGQTRWGAMAKVPREFCFTDCYWEWL